jgi:hypothetical protein
MGTNSGGNVKINDRMVVDLIVMTTCISLFQKPFWTLTQCQNFPPSQTCFSTNVVHASLYEVISPLSDCG